MLQWLFKQKYRVDRGYQMISLVNLSLLLLQSSVLKEYLGISSTALILLGLPIVLITVWAVGYLISYAQVHEDRAMAEVSPSRRELEDILKLLKELTNDHRMGMDGVHHGQLWPRGSRERLGR
jgi:predicted ferric reductase